MPGYADQDLVRNTSGVSAEDLGLETSQQLDTVIADLNTRATALINREVSRDFLLHEDQVEEFDGNDRRSIRLEGYPVVSVDSVEVNDTVIPTDDWRVRASTGILERRNTTWPRGWNNIKVTYTYGYQEPPSEIKHLTETVLTRLLQYAMQNTATKGASTINMDGFSVTYGVEFAAAESFTPVERRVLNKFKKVGAV